MSAVLAGIVPFAFVILVRMNLKKTCLKSLLFLSIVIVAFSFAAIGLAGEYDLKPRFSIQGFYKDALNAPVGVFFDKGANELYVADAGLGEVMVFDSLGSPVFRFGAKSGILDPIDVAVKDGLIYLTQGGRPHIEVFNFKGEPKARIMPDGLAFEPGRIALDSSGKLYVVNKKLTNCAVFDLDGRFLFSIGERLKSISGVAVSDDRVYLITPFDPHAIMVYDKNGKFLFGFEGLQERGGSMGLPGSAAVDKVGRLWVIDALVGVVVFDPNGKELTRGGKYDNVKIRAKFPVDIALSDDFAYIADKGRRRVDAIKVEW
jgi:DNA-binding beta-propeller fold protein YncE